MMWPGGEAGLKRWCMSSPLGLRILKKVDEGVGQRRPQSEPLYVGNDLLPSPQEYCSVCCQLDCQPR